MTLPFAKSLACAVKGIYIAFKSERNFRIHVVALCLAVALGFYLSLDIMEWGLIIFSIGFVLVAELFNTTLERLGDEVADGEEKQLIQNAKDISAAAVLLAAITALIIGIIVLFVPFIQKMLELLWQ